MRVVLLHRRFRLLFYFLRQQRRRAGWVLCLDLSANICTVALSLLLAQVVARWLGISSVRGGWMGLNGWESSLVFGIFLGLAVLKLGLDALRFRVRGQLGERWAHDLRLLTFKRLLQTDIARFEHLDMGRSLLRFSGDMSSVQRLLTHGILQFLADWGLLLLGLSAIFCLDVRMALVVCVLLGLAWLLSRWLNRRIELVEVKRRARKSALLAYVNASLHALSGIQALNRRPRQERGFERQSEQVRQIGYQYHRLESIQRALPSFLALVLAPAALGLSGLTGAAGPGLFAAILVLMSWRMPLVRLLRVGLVWKKGALSLDKIEALLHRPIAAEGQQILTSEGASSLRVRELGLDLSGRAIFRGVSFHLKTGQTTCLAWPTGSGKTALVKLLAGLYPAASGTCEWNGWFADQLTAHSLRRQVAFVSEAFPIIGANLVEALSNSRKPQALATTAKALAEYQKLFPNVFPYLDTARKISVHSSWLSVGQQRLLQCLRAVLSDKPFWVFDDPFAGLDTETAIQLAGFLQQHRSGKAILILTTRPDVLLAAGWDKLVVHTMDMKKNDASR